MVAWCRARGARHHHCVAATVAGPVWHQPATPGSVAGLGQNSSAFLADAVKSCPTSTDMVRMVRSELLYPIVAGGNGISGSNKERRHAYKLPTSEAALRTVDASLDALVEAERSGKPVPRLHPAVKEVHDVQDPVRRAAQERALLADVQGARERCKSKAAAQQDKRARD